MQEREGFRVFTFGGEIEHVATVGAVGASRGDPVRCSREKQLSVSFLTINGEETRLQGCNNKNKLQTEATLSSYLIISVEGNHYHAARKPTPHSGIA